MANRKPVQKTSQSRIFTIDGGASPGNAPVYQGFGVARAFSWSLGNATPVRVPSQTRYGYFDIVDKIRAQRGLPTLSLEFRKTRDLSDVLALAKKGCDVDIQVHVGVCTDPTDFFSYELIHVLEGAIATDYNLSDLGAMDGDQEAPVQETVPFEGLNYYEIKQLDVAELAGTSIVQEIVGVALMNLVSCGDCGLPGDGSNIAFAVTKSHAGSPGLPAKVVFTSDGWANVGTSSISSLAANMDPIGMAIVGTHLVVISNEENSLHYAPVVDILNGVETWTKVITGFVVSKAPRAIVSLGRTYTWIVGDGGYVYFSEDITGGVVVQSAGDVTIQNLRAISALDLDTLVAVGESNAVIITQDGGTTWGAITGPSVGIILNAVVMKSELNWLIGNAGGNLFYTIDGGYHWSSRAFQASGTGAINSIAFSTAAVGYMTHVVSSRGFLLRTINGGRNWQRVPELAGRTFPDNDSLGPIAVVGPDYPRGPNYVLVGGLGANAVDGALFKATA